MWFMDPMWYAKDRIYNEGLLERSQYRKEKSVVTNARSHAVDQYARAGVFAAFGLIHSNCPQDVSRSYWHRRVSRVAIGLSQSGAAMFRSRRVSFPNGNFVSDMEQCNPCMGGRGTSIEEVGSSLRSMAPIWVIKTAWRAL